MSFFHSLIAVRGIQPQQLGTLFSESFANLNNWTQVGAGTFTPSSSGLTVKDGTTSFITNYIKYNPLANSLEKWKITCEFVAEVTGSGIIIGLHSRMNDDFPTLNRSFYARFTSNATDYGAYVISFQEGAGTTATSVATSTLTPYSVGDSFRLEFERNGYVYTATCYNLTKGTSRSSTYTAAQGTTILAANNGGKFILGALGGQQKVTSYAVTSNSYKNIRALFIGDSITAGVYANGALRAQYAPLVFAGSSKRYEVNAGGNDRTLVYVEQENMINLFNADYVFLMIGGNDHAGGVSSATYQSNYTAIRNNIVAGGAIPVHLLATPRDATNMTTFNSWISSTFTNDLIIDTFTPLKDSGTSLAAAYDSGDGIHPNATAAQVIADTIRAAMPSLY